MINKPELNIWMVLVKDEALHFFEQDSFVDCVLIKSHKKIWVFGRANEILVVNLVDVRQALKNFPGNDFFNLWIGDGKSNRSVSIARVFPLAQYFRDGRWCLWFWFIGRIVSWIVGRVCLNVNENFFVDYVIDKAGRLDRCILGRNRMRTIRRLQNKRGWARRFFLQPWRRITAWRK